MAKIAVGLYGCNGHQLQDHLRNHPDASLVAVAAFTPEKYTETLRSHPNLRNYATLDELLADSRIELVSLCSPRRDAQADEAVQSLRAGKHVYAEKPCALTEADLDRILNAAREAGRQFHEMAGTAFDQPYLEMRKIVAAGTIGTVVQVLAQKSYPLGDHRPLEEGVDGGLLMQVGIHAVRMIEHVAQTPVKSVIAQETQLGNSRQGDLRIAASMMMRLENGGLATVIANYLNPPAFGHWGNEMLRIFGTQGFIEAVDGGTRTRLVLNNTDCGKIDVSKPAKDYFDLYIDSLLDKTPMPLTLEQELHPTRIVIRAKQQL